MPTYRDFAMSLALGWAVSTGASIAWCGDGAVAVTPPPAQGPAAADRSIDLEVIRERYPDRTVKVERHVIQDSNLNYLNHGPWTMWDPAGTVIAKGEYWQGKRHGEWKRFYIAGADGHPNDLPEKDTAARDEAFDGPEFKGYKKPFTSSATFVEDKIVGTWSVTDADGRNIFSIDLDRNLPQGKAVWYLASGGKQREIDFKNGVVDGEWQEWDATGNQTRKDRFIEGRRQAEAIAKFDSGEKSSEGTYLYPKENVLVNIDWWSGAVKVQVAGTEGKPIKQGKWNYWYEDGGKRCEAEYIDDKPVARHVWWYRNGQKECEGEYVDGKSQGTWIYWHENGQKAAQGDYQNGTKVGKWVRWSGEGKVVEAKDHPYGDIGMQPMQNNQAFQNSVIQQQGFPQNGFPQNGVIMQSVPQTVPQGPGYPIGLNQVPTQNVVLQPTPADGQIIVPQSQTMQPLQPVQSASKSRGLFRLK